MTNLKALNTTQSPPTSFPFTFQIPPHTDLYRKPALTSASQPTFYTPITLKNLRSATVKIKKIQYAHLYDQAGIVILWANRPEIWIKAGVEYFEGKLKRSSVAPGVGGWSDWNIAEPVKDGEGIVVEAKRDRPQGTALVLTVNGQMVRKISGVFEDEEEPVWVGIYGARPADVHGVLEVEVEAFEIEQV
ncbi:hypothetical protein CC1G_06586 [Coprinopsis cinerea okayama7|uniref:Uncharacterized protein n=1 Tax=Coprinopsis cinerea (strain Okayama-7 / 130 / ATCC MYA-4618 / FGSC 9003) TaxID=240176 RepID=A8N314_COPC7|nr:hypothetical protein CC1G_06586 [Coprinopsis cinerea okayama7\|eukprot:XP_001829249.1 hypothetical protein CC1G_06586 [Coprinopsis cinerea okayama7\